MPELIIAVPLIIAIIINVMTVLSIKKMMEPDALCVLADGMESVHKGRVTGSILHPYFAPLDDDQNAQTESTWVYDCGMQYIHCPKLFSNRALPYEYRK